MKLYLLLSGGAFLAGVLAGALPSDTPLWLKILIITLCLVVHVLLVLVASMVYASERPDPITGEWE